MGRELSPAEIQRMKDEAHEDMKETIDELRRDEPKAADAAGAVVGIALGGSASFTALYFGGSVAGLSAAGITSGLAAAGFGAGMLAGIGVLTLPVAILGVGGYAIVKKRRSAKLAAALDRAIEKLYKIQERLIANAEYFRDELAEIKAYIDQFKHQKP